LVSIVLAACDVLYRLAVRAEDEFLLVYCERLFGEMSKSTTSDGASNNSIAIE
jgi:hypothetical protein